MDSGQEKEATTQGITYDALKPFKVFSIILIGASVFPLLSVPTPTLPGGFIWEIDFAAILAVSLVLAIKYPSFGKRWAFLLFAVGVAEFEFSHNIPHYNILVVGMFIGLATAYSGIIIPVSYWAKQHFRKKQVKVFFAVSGCLELIIVSLSILYRVSVKGPIMALLGFGLLIIGFYSLIVGVAGFFFGKPKKQ